MQTLAFDFSTMEALSFEDLLDIDGGTTDKTSVSYQVGHAIGEGIAGAAVVVGLAVSYMAYMAL